MNNFSESCWRIKNFFWRCGGGGAFDLDYINDQLIIPVGRVFANSPEDLGSIPGRVIAKTLKMVLDTSLLNTQQYKVRVKGKVEQLRERSSPPLHCGVVATEKGAFWLPSTKGDNFNYSYYYFTWYSLLDFELHGKSENRIILTIGWPGVG